MKIAHNYAHRRFSFSKIVKPLKTQSMHITLCCESSVEIFRQINCLVFHFYLVKMIFTLLSRNICQKKFECMQCCDILQIICKNFREISLRGEMQLDLTKNNRHLKYVHTLCIYSVKTIYDVISIYIAQSLLFYVTFAKMTSDFA